jgi:hypothetical protein
MRDMGLSQTMLVAHRGASGASEITSTVKDAGRGRRVR